ncbi:DUF4349 domain-containing protein [Rhodococcoides corynebacterioides]|uniref:DUF4349 domain-containing protein n=1 Tax=Rhodococcoides corynebacterioides TaxID=53972 RepID=UPI00082ACE6A|nr:DUF4349 domain-containing protein [Rhodococcus corynebacterioides]MBY6350768.1 DUF4349 domain-containing protein [Rhodococcus corynebacterioides]
MRTARPRTAPTRRLAAVLCIAGMLAAAGCATREPDLGPGGESPDAGAVTAPGTDSGIALAEAAPARSQVTPTRQDVVNATVSLDADDPIGAADRAQALAEQRGGRVDSRTDSPSVDDGPASAALTLRVPAAEVDAALDEFGTIGRVTAVGVDRTDVTDQVIDVDARIAALDATVTRLRDLLATASSTADLLAAETALADRQGELDSLRGQQQSLREQIDLATVSVRITETETASRGGIGGAFADGWHALLRSLTAVGLFLVAAVPWAVLVAVVVALVVGVLRLRRRRTRRS